MSLRRWITAAILFAVSLLVTVPRAEAQVKPFSIVGVGRVSHLPFPGDTAEFWSIGAASLLGAYRQEPELVEPLTLAPLDPQDFYPHRFGTVVGIGTFQNATPVTFESLGGGSLTFNYGRKTPGIVELILVGQEANGAPIYTTEWDAIFTLVSGSGRFKKAIEGEFRMIAVTDLFGDEAFIPNHDWATPGIGYIWYSLPGGYVKFRK